MVPRNNIHLNNMLLPKSKESHWAFFFLIKGFCVYKQTHFWTLSEKQKFFVFKILVENICSFDLEIFGISKSTSNVVRPQTDRQCYLHVGIRLITFGDTLIHHKNSACLISGY